MCTLYSHWGNTSEWSLVYTRCMCTLYLWSIQTELEWDQDRDRERDWDKWFLRYYCYPFTLQWDWDRDHDQQLKQWVSLMCLYCPSPSPSPLVGSFIHVDVQQWGQGNRHTGNSYVKHRLPPTPSLGICRMLRCNCANGKIKENQELR